MSIAGYKARIFIGPNGKPVFEPDPEGPWWVTEYESKQEDMNWSNNQPAQEQLSCGDAHRVGNVIPQSHNIELDQQICNCGQWKFFKEKCSCPSGGYLLKQIPNPDYHG